MKEYKEYLQREGFKDTSIHSYTTTIQELHSFLAYKYKKHFELYEIKTRHLTEFLEHKRDSGVAYEYLKGMPTRLRKYFDFLEQHGYIARDPAVKLKGVHKEKPTIIAAFDYSLLLEKRSNIVQSSAKNIVKAIYILSLYGCRFGEISQLEKENVVEEGDRFVIYPMTGQGKRREIELSPEDSSVFSQHFVDSVFIPSEYVFNSKIQHSNDYQPMERVSYSAYLQKIREVTNLKEYGLDNARLAYIHHLYTVERYSIETIAAHMQVERASIGLLSKEFEDRFPIEKFKAL